ncbi:gluconate 2-dehydrogenase subunit 3 family protein [soil metagenome]
MSDALRTPYPGYDVLAKWDSPSWNEQTREVVARRLREVPERRFLSEDLYAVLEAVVARLLPQPDRPDDPVPIAPWLDHRLYTDGGDGYRRETMPPQREAWPQGLRALDAESRRRHGAGLCALDPAQQDDLLRDVQRGAVRGGSWESIPAAAFFGDVLSAAVGVYYALPAAWSEIGFGGPASPRGYVRLGADQRDPWEAEEHR